MDSAPFVFSIVFAISIAACILISSSSTYYPNTAARERCVEFFVPFEGESVNKTQCVFCVDAGVSCNWNKR